MLFDFNKSEWQQNDDFCLNSINELIVIVNSFKILKKYINIYMMFKRFIFLSAFLFSSIALLKAQKIDSTSDAYKAIYDESGNLSSEGYLEDGKPNGYWITYYKNGLRKSEGNRVNFMLDGLWKFYQENGNLKNAISYREDKKNGAAYYYENCQLIKEENYENGLLDGRQIEYFQDTGELKPKRIIPYQEGREEGMGFEFAKDGRVLSIFNYEKGFLKSKETLNRFNPSGQKEGIWKSYYKSYRLKKEERFKSGLLNGYVKYYNPEGKLDSAILFIDGERQNKEENIAEFNLDYTYYPNGQIKEITTYNLASQKDGLSTVYNESGEVISSEFYSKDQLLKKGIIDNAGLEQGIWEFYYLSGELKSKGAYTNGNRTGKWTFYFRNGKTEQEGFYDDNGKYTGLWKWYYENGNILRSEEFRRGVEDGDLAEYNIDGKVITQGEYIEGEKEGEWFYELNDHREEGKYRYGLRNGEWKHYYPNGKMAFIGSYIEGEPEGKHKYFYENGVLEKEENYSYGEKDGKWKWYDKDGMETLTIVYKDGLERKIDGKRVKFNEKK